MAGQRFPNQTIEGPTFFPVKKPAQWAQGSTSLPAPAFTIIALPILTTMNQRRTLKSHIGQTPDDV